MSTPLHHRAAAVIAALAALATAGPARACFDVDTSPNPFIWFTSATTAQVAIEGAVVKAAGLSIGDYCAVGLGHSGTLITGVTALAVMDDADPGAGPVPIAGLSFTSNATTTTDFGTACAQRSPMHVQSSSRW